ncbi:MAG TPA: DUF5693 family protein [Abditibacterium sp.]
MNFTSPRFRLGWILVAIGLANALFWTVFRWNFENHLDQAQLTLDFEDTRSLSDAFGVSQGQLLRDLRARGASSLAIYNQTLGTLRDNARLTLTSRESAQRLYPRLDWAKIPASYRYLVASDDAALIDQIWPRLQEQSPRTSPVKLVPVDGGQRVILIPNSKQLVGDAQLGYDPRQIEFARALGYSLTARLSNPLNLTPSRLQTLLDDVEKTGAKIVIFADDEVLGYESLLSGAAREMRQRGLLFTNIEFSKQRGAGDFAKNSEGQLVRLHSVNGDESSRAKPEVLVDRFVRAVKDRNMRVIYVRLLRQQKGEPVEAQAGEIPPLAIEKTPYQQNLEFIEQISSELNRQALPVAWLRPAMQMGQAQPFGDYPAAQLSGTLGDKGGRIARYGMLFLSGLGTVGATLLLLNLFFDLSASARRCWLYAGLVLIAILSVSAGIGAKLMALQTGLIFPVIAILWGGLPLVWDGQKTTEARGPLPIALFGFKILWKTTLLTLIGGFLVVSLLNHWKYMSKADEFLGEKATQFVPLLLVPLAFLGEIFPHRVERNGAAAGRARAMSRVNRALSQPFTARIALLSIATLAGGYIWMARFGNESGMEISTLELNLRATLEKVFITRPRTKEIFMGHPAFLLAVLFMLRRQKWLAWGALVLATIGQTDVLNTMCHIHTPVFYSLWRSLTGVFLGTLGGFVALWIFTRIGPRPQMQRVEAPPASEPAPEEAKSLNFTF